MDGAGIKAAVQHGPFRSVRCFGKDVAGPYAKAASFFVELQGPIPASLLGGRRGHVQPRGPGALETCGKGWG